MPSAEVVALEQQLAAAREAEATAAATHPEEVHVGGGPIDTSGMPGGEDSAPVSQPDPATQVEQVVTDVAPAIDEGVDIVKEVKDGTPVADIANKLLDSNGLHAIVKAIGDLVKVVNI